MVKLQVLAGAFAGCKRKGDAGQTEAIASFVRSRGRMDRLAFGVLVAERLGRGDAACASRKAIGRHVSEMAGAIEDAHSRDKIGILERVAERESLPFFSSTVAVATLLDPEGAAEKIHVAADQAREEASSVVIGAAKRELASRSALAIWERKHLERRVGELRAMGVLFE